MDPFWPTVCVGVLAVFATIVLLRFCCRGDRPAPAPAAAAPIAAAAPAPDNSRLDGPFHPGDAAERKHDPLEEISTPSPFLHNPVSFCSHLWQLSVVLAGAFALLPSLSVPSSSLC